MNDNVIETFGLTRYFGNQCAVNQVELAVPRGSVLALLGRNGSGKSTFIRMLLGLLAPTRGSCRVLANDCQHLPPAARRRIGYIAEGHPMIHWMRVRDLESFQKSFYPDWDKRMFQSIAGQFDLPPGTRAGKLSRGQRAGLSLALVMGARPELLIMDDPMIGLDPVARRILLEAMILVMRNPEHTILFSSHLLDDVERVADHVGIIDRGVLRVSGTVQHFRARVRRFSWRFRDAPPASLPPISGLLEERRDSDELLLTLADPAPGVEQLISSLGAVSMLELPLSLEDAVIAYLGRRGGTLLQSDLG